MRPSTPKQANCLISFSGSVEFQHTHYSNLLLQKSTKRPVIKFWPLSLTHRPLTSIPSVSQRNTSSFVCGKQIINSTAPRSHITRTSHSHSNHGILNGKHYGTSLIERTVELYGNSNQIPS